MPNIFHLHIKNPGKLERHHLLNFVVLGILRFSTTATEDLKVEFGINHQYCDGYRAY